ncbi:hypothetical protein BWR19_08425 [Halomonas sp. 1513]|nr:glycosyltransferase [Halomonas sp. 1513]APX92953.1 hypothetical protein BWR19_08425 [Halomonas sp. 1513]
MKQAQAPRASVIIPTYYDWPSLQHCLAALARQTLPAPQFEVLIVNNAPKDPPPADMRWAENVRLLHEARPGSYAARNAGLEAAKGELVALVDADCMPEPKWLEAALANFEDPQLSLLAGHVALTFEGEKLTPAECFEKAFAFRQQENAEQGVSVTANLIVRHSVFQTVGCFDEQLMSGGDFEWTGRATRRGHVMRYAADCVVTHPARHRLSELAAKARRVTAGSQVLYNEGALGGWRRVLGNLMGDVVSLWRRQDMTWRERAWALAVLVYLKGVKAQQRLSAMLPWSSARREAPR